MPLQGFQKQLGLELLEVGRSQLMARVSLGEHLMNSRGAIHGGALMSIADSLGGMGAVQNLAPSQFTTTLESKTNFLARACGDHVIVRSHALHVGKRTSVWSTVICDESGRTISVTTQTQLHFTDG
jgi:uncharacterized protein (TIGR00369 family)